MMAVRGAGGLVQCHGEMGRGEVGYREEDSVQGKPLDRFAHGFIAGYTDLRDTFIVSFCFEPDSLPST